MVYVKIEKGYVTDCISYPYGNYIPVNSENPSDIMNGCYKLQDNEFILDEAKLAEQKANTKKAIIDEFLASLIDSGVI